jgi:hypothetical protein
MAQIDFDCIFGSDTPALIDVVIGAFPDPQDESFYDEIEFKGIVDTGSRQCVINAGVLSDYYFGEQPTSETLTDGLGAVHSCKIQTMLLTLSQAGKTKRFRLPVYEMPLADHRRGAPYMLLGRSLLNLGRLVYDGPNMNVRLTFEIDGNSNIERSTRQKST